MFVVYNFGSSYNFSCCALIVSDMEPVVLQNIRLDLRRPLARLHLSKRLGRIACHVLREAFYVFCTDQKISSARQSSVCSSVLTLGFASSACLWCGRPTSGLCDWCSKPICWNCISCMGIIPFMSCTWTYKQSRGIVCKNRRFWFVKPRGILIENRKF